ncbi:hypothetical protein [Caulobacter mirabilis]|uniref:Cyclase n=1 Tax=Caulobacter mirabilis TaxID=69666 RepID=A0A2D2AXL9_9CAUL|nr:hypothetical protein [Caulobacter mirabilis]ATQ42769.1 hypothetical protein CSW64_10280 [Caulobacter mirabilis]
MGINAELGPWIYMTFPAEALVGLSAAPLKTPLFVSWLLLGRVIPFDRHVFVLSEVGARHFVEESHSTVQSRWRHERWIEPDGPDACTVRDIVTVEPRLGFMGFFARPIAAAVFHHRHKRLRLLYS